MKNTILLAFILYSMTAWSQNLDLIHNDYNVSIKAQNLNSVSGPSLQLANDLSHSLQLGISGSAPLFGVGNEGYLSLSTGEDFLIRTNDTTRLRIGSNGLESNYGGHVSLRSPDNQEAFGIRTENDGAMYIMQNNDPLKNIMYLDDDNIRVGIGTVLANTELEVRQSVTPSLNGANATVTDIAGLTIQSNSGSRATMFVHTDNDLTFTFNDVYRSFINDISGEYIAVSDRRLKKDIHTLPTVLAKVNNLRPSGYIMKSDEEGNKQIGFIAQEVERIFPELVHTKDGIKGLSYDQFSVIAIKAIQEQQALITKLQERITRLEEAEK